MSALAGAVLLVVLLGGVLLPFVVWIERRLAPAQPGLAVPLSPPDERPLLDDVLAPFVRARDWLARPDPIGPGAAPVGARVAPLVGWLAALAVLALVPLGSRYDILREPSELWLADPEQGLLLACVALALAGLAAAWTGVAGARPPSQQGGLRAAGQSLAAVVALVASLLPMFVLYASLRASEIAAVQDAVIPFARIAAALAAETSRTAASGPGLPAWGIFLNPLSFVLVIAAATAAVGARPCDAPTAGTADRGVTGELAGARRVLVRATDGVWTVAVAALLVLLFFGGWSLPWLPQAVVVGFVEPWFGRGFAELVCAVLHLGSSAAKLAAMIALLVYARARWPRLRDARVRALALAWVVPLALLDAFATAAAVVAFAGARA